jgi:ABC-type enterochelin transport system permease subunit
MIILQRLSYFIFAVFVSTLFVYLLHRTFTPNDIINIPVLAIIIYLIINYSAEITYEKNLEKFLNQQSDSSI